MNDAVRPALLARIAGLCYLLVIAGGLFAEMAVRGTLVVPGDPAATVEAIAENETLWRWGLAVHLLYLLPALVVNVLVSELFKSVQATLARLALACAVTSVAIEAMSLLQMYVPAAMLRERDALGGPDEALAYLAVRLFSAGFGIALVLFAGFCVLVGVLILGSRRVPRIIGWLMVAAGIAYVVNTLTFVVAPGVQERLVPLILLPSLVGELSLALWFLLRGDRLNDRHDSPEVLTSIAR
ncbi:DUF4386 domain-containing protein [Solwaraspora sp. WMMD1047]|uniref:DUF4386 domain-containing protein n=1 Tax=Solwaraspora sp. WMMD1047 TaxID=3016102 RepID=UPI002416FF6B|nr:DUF4386 domain-containing protein [Solwaraspora sp. WMMD1047]MDG4830601.1 DUF4386 domain-containing protein [Solwaraspora sp. WMMD1047]